MFQMLRDSATSAAALRSRPGEHVKVFAKCLVSVVVNPAVMTGFGLGGLGFDTGV